VDVERSSFFSKQVFETVTRGNDAKSYRLEYTQHAMEITFLTELQISGTHYPTMLSRHLPLVPLNENSKIFGYHSLLRKLHSRYIFYSIFSDFTCVISMRYYVFNGFLSVQAFLPWNHMKLVYRLVLLSWLFMFHK